ncbi:MAG: hypothetical protein JO132_02440, partial [Streptosporangiaceae bacterium]|nr:hypothetical protein [Streptosporangiaceae bacterium]
AVGYDADLVAFDPGESYVVDPSRLHHRHRLTPYSGRALSGRVRQTWLRGNALPGGDAGLGSPAGEPCGRLLGRGTVRGSADA